jgi:hypothetical protein
MLSGYICLASAVFALFLAQPEEIALPGTPAARRRLKREDPSLYERLELERADEQHAAVASVAKCLGSTCPTRSGRSSPL